MSAKSKREIGQLGEAAAVAYLQKKGYRILERNYRNRHGELDVICLDRGTLVFVEVKTRTSNSFGLPEESVTPQKLRRLRQLVNHYILDRSPSFRQLRIDVVALLLDRQTAAVVELRHFENVS